MYFLFIFLFIINCLIILNLKEFGYGLLVLNIANDIQLHINSNGIGRFFAITTIICGAVCLNKNIKVHLKLIAAIIFFYFLFLTIITEGRLNLLIVLFGIFFLIFFWRINTFVKLFLQFIILVFIVLSHNQYTDYKIKKIEEVMITNDTEKNVEASRQIVNLKANSLRIYQNLETHNNFIRCEICPEFLMNEKPNIILEKLNNITNGRFYKWSVILYANPKRIFGNGSNADRVILSSKFLEIEYGNVNNDSASSIIYIYSASGIVGCMALLIFLLLIFIKFTQDYKKNYLKNNSVIVCAWAIIIMVIIRSLFENSYAILSVDLFVMIASLTFLNIFKNFSISQKNN
jgi:O-antigen ligase